MTNETYINTANSISWDAINSSSKTIGSSGISSGTITSAGYPGYGSSTVMGGGYGSTVWTSHSEEINGLKNKIEELETENKCLDEQIRDNVSRSDGQFSVIWNEFRQIKEENEMLREQVKTLSNLVNQASKKQWPEMNF